VDDYILQGEDIGVLDSLHQVGVIVQRNFQGQFETAPVPSKGN